MDDRDWLAERFEEQRPRLRAVAYRMLGSTSEAEDAVQDTWLKLSGADTSEVQNLAAWLTTVVARVCLNVLRSRTHRREDPLDIDLSEPAVSTEGGSDPEHEALLADSVGLALLVVLDTLAPAERLAFVLHDMFAVPFEDIAPLLDKTPAATRQLASRARRRVQGQAPAPGTDGSRQRDVVSAFLAASRSGDFEALVSLLDPEVVLRADKAAGPTPSPLFIRGALAVARGAGAAAERSRVSELALVNGVAGLVMASEGRLSIVLSFTVVAGRITEIDVIADQDRLDELDLAILT